jgi:hypothetical protein
LYLCVNYNLNLIHSNAQEICYAGDLSAELVGNVIQT